MFAGVCGGLGEAFGIDPTLIRLGWALLTILGGSGILLYVIAAFIIPSGDDDGETIIDSNYDKYE